MNIMPIIFHEIGHSLGINAATHTISQMIGEKEYSINVFRDIDDKSYSVHLYDQYGTKATSNAIILPSKEDISSLNAILEANPALKEDIKPENIFYVPDTTEARRDGKIYLYFAGVRFIMTV